MRLILVSLVAVVLAGCATTPIEGAAEVPRNSGTFAVATIAPFGSFEWEAAPGYTRLAVARRLAARLLDRGQITVDQARQVQAAGDAAREALDAARRRSDLGDKAGASRVLKLALQSVATVEGMVQEARR